VNFLGFQYSGSLQDTHGVFVAADLGTVFHRQNIINFDYILKL